MFFSVTNRVAVLVTIPPVSCFVLNYFICEAFSILHLKYAI